ncbi:MAG: adenosylcobinamide-phosphate synthase CbiB [Acidimicrobiia bacterium]
MSAFGAAIAVMADRALGEPPTPVHPVAKFGNVMNRLEGHLWRDHRGAGIAHCLAGTALGAGTGVGLSRLTGAAAASAAAGTLAVGGRMLGDVAADIGAALERDDLDGARALLPGLVGRSPEHLGTSEIARAVIESVAENTVDAIVAPALWTAALGAPGALAYRAVNTLDAMVGHRNARYEQFGWASARLDDVANWIPARFTACLVAAARPRAATAVWTCVRRDAPAHPSPNSGVAEAAFAAALGVQLGGVNTYGDRVEDRGTLGIGRAPTGNDIAAAVRLSRDVSMACAVALALLAGSRWLRAERAARPGDSTRNAPTDAGARS